MLVCRSWVLWLTGSSCDSTVLPSGSAAAAHALPEPLGDPKWADADVVPSFAVREVSGLPGG